MSRTVPIIIDSFTGDFAFLDNSYPCDVLFDGLRYPSAEHAYQASKTDDPNKKLIVANLLDGATARSYGKSRLKITTEFTLVRLSIMRRILEAKFFDNISLAKMLIETMDSVLCYPARGNDLYWGCRNRGKNGDNKLGLLLMEIRAQMQQAVQRQKDIRMAKVKFSGGLGIDELRAKLAALNESPTTAFDPTETIPDYPDETLARVTHVEQTDNPNGLTGIGLSVPAANVKPGDIIVGPPIPPPRP